MNSTLYDTINDQLTADTKQFFDDLLLADSPINNFSSRWEYLKQEMKKASVSNIRQFTDYLLSCHIFGAMAQVPLLMAPIGICIPTTCLLSIIFATASTEGIEYTRDDLSILSAYFRENINRYGIFELSRARQSMPLNTPSSLIKC